MKVCSKEACTKKQTAKGFCDNHYRQFKMKIDPEFKKRRLKIQDNWRKAHPESIQGRRHSKAKAHAKKNKKSFTLTKSEYYGLISYPCYYCNGRLKTSKYGIGLDRIDNSKGYELGNVLSACGECNRTRGDRFTVEETKAIIELVLKLRDPVTGNSDWEDK